MSEWAIGEGDNKTRTAYEFRELFFDEGAEFIQFRCPFCAIPLTPVNLYAMGEIARTPHFRAHKTPHRFECDGYKVLCPSSPVDGVIYTLQSNQWIELDGGATKHPVEVIIPTQSMNATPHSQQIVLKQLETAATGLEARWFAYGIMSLRSDVCYRLIVENLDHLYVHRLRKPVK